MRLLSRSALPGHRRLPGPRWRRVIIAAASAGVILAGIGGGVVRLDRAGIIDEAAATTAARVAALGSDLGLSVENVAVSGREQVSRAAILQALGVRRGMPILAVDLAAAKRRLEALAWVRNADVERRLPDTIFVHLVERQRLAFWQRQGKLELIDQDGKVVPTDRLDGLGALVVFVGDDAPQLAPALLDMLAREPALAPHVAAAVRVGGRRWNLRLDNGIDVALPEDDAEGAWHRLAALDRADALLERNILAVDLRLPDRLVLRLPPEPAKSAPTKPGKPPGKPT